ncbi:hypothetical protein TorRG33x02_269840, partial [Trema orientale]
TPPNFGRLHVSSHNHTNSNYIHSHYCTVELKGVVNFEVYLSLLVAPQLKYQKDSVFVDCISYQWILEALLLLFPSNLSTSSETSSQLLWGYYGEEHLQDPTTSKA